MLQWGIKGALNDSIKTYRLRIAILAHEKVIVNTFLYENQ